MKRTLFAVAAAAALGSGIADTRFARAADTDHAVDAIKTASPIKHVIIIVGENRSFDHLFATYAPQRRDEKILNLLSQGIVNADGTPGPHFARGHQFQIVAPPCIHSVLFGHVPEPTSPGVGVV